MNLFQQSSLTYTAAKLQVVRSAGAVTDTDLSTMAGQALTAAVERWNNKKAWSFMLCTAPTFSYDTSLGADYNLPPDFAGPYNLKDTYNKRNLTPKQQREWDWADPTGTPGTPACYGMFLQGGTGKLRLYPTPASYGQLSLKYYRKMAIPMESLTVTGCTCSASRVSLTHAVTTTGSDIVSVTSGAGACYSGEVFTVTGGLTAGTTILDVRSDTSLQVSAVATGAVDVTGTVGGTVVTTTTVNGFAGVRRGVTVTGTGVATGSTVRRVIDATTLELSLPISAAMSNVSLTFDSATQWMDIPADYERGIISLAKYYYLRDKGGDEARVQGWQQESEKAFAEALANDATVTDEQIGFKPGYLGPNDNIPASPNDIRWAFTDWV
jgi:hypothetical protein